MPRVLRHLAEEASSDLREVAAEDDAVDGVATVERAYHVAATSWSHLTEVAVAVEYSLSSQWVLHAAYLTPVRHKDAGDNVVEASNRVRDSW